MRNQSVFLYAELRTVQCYDDAEESSKVGTRFLPSARFGESRGG